MAVLLCRSDGDPFPNPPPPEVRGLPKLTVQYQPLPHHLDYQGKLVAARSEAVYACNDESREATWKESRKRHHQQVRECGFHSTYTEPYKDLGEVILDDGKLILEALGQAKEQDNTQKRNSLVSEKPISLPALHTKAIPSSQNELLSLDQKVFEGNLRLEEMRKGRPLSVLMEEEEEKKRLDKETQQRNDSGADNHWVKCDDEWSNQLPPILESVAAVDSKLPPFSDSATAEDEKSNTPSEEPTGLSPDMPACASSTTMGTHSVDPSSSTDKHHDSEPGKHPVPVEGPPSLEDTADRLDSWLDQKKDGVTGKQLIFSDFILERWYRKLSVMVWILETMKADQPYLCRPFATCWYITQPNINPTMTKKSYEKSIANFRLWNSLEKFEQQPKRIIPRMKTIVSIMRLRSGSHQVHSNSISNDNSNPSQSSMQAPSIGAEGSANNPESSKQSKQPKTSLVRKKPFQNDSLKVKFDTQTMKKCFEDVYEERAKIVHEQLKAMDRDRMRGTKERLSSLSVTANLHKDLRTMRKGVKIESTEMARKRLLINFEWFEQLNEILPPLVKENVYCSRLLNKLEALAVYIRHHTDKMSKTRVLDVLVTLRPWELMSPDVDPAIRHIITHVIYISEQHYESWLKIHSEDQKIMGIDNVHAVSMDGHRLPVNKT